MATAKEKPGSWCCAWCSRLWIRLPRLPNFPRGASGAAASLFLSLLPSLAPQITPFPASGRIRSSCGWWSNQSLWAPDNFTRLELGIPVTVHVAWTYIFAVRIGIRWQLSRRYCKFRAFHEISGPKCLSMYSLQESKEMLSYSSWVLCRIKLVGYGSFWQVHQKI